MSEQTAIVPSGFIAPVTDVQNALLAYQAMKDFVASVLRETVDFGKIPGTDKPTLLKPGAEKLARFFGMSITVNELESDHDWIGERHGGEAFFFYRYKAVASRNGMPIAEGVGSCSNWEKKYRYRNSQRVCPECKQTTIIKGKKEYGGGWLCYKAKGGCGAKFNDNDKKITDQEVGQVVNPDPADIVNTIDKMAQKRAIIAAVLLACNASEYFTQDVEDYIDAEFVETKNGQKEDVRVDKPSTTPNPSNNKMTLETAENITNGRGTRYGDLETKTLASMSNTMQKVLDGKVENKAGHSVDDLKFRMDAIAVILNSRNGGSK